MTDQKTLKKKKPNFYRQDAHKKPKLGFKWRKPKGSDSKMRRNLKGYRKSPDTGYGSAKVFRGLHPSGLAMLVVNQISQLQGIDPKVTGILLSATLGQRKRVDIVKEAEKNKITILNVKDPAAYLKAVEEDMKNRKEKKEAIKVTVTNLLENGLSYRKIAQQIAKDNPLTKRFIEDVCCKIRRGIKEISPRVPKSSPAFSE